MIALLHVLHADGIATKLCDACDAYEKAKAAAIIIYTDEPIDLPQRQEGIQVLKIKSSDAAELRLGASAVIRDAGN